VVTTAETPNDSLGKRLGIHPNVSEGDELVRAAMIEKHRHSPGKPGRGIAWQLDFVPAPDIVVVPERSGDEEDSGQRVLELPVGNELDDDRGTERMAHQNGVVAHHRQFLQNAPPPGSIVGLGLVRHLGGTHDIARSQLLLEAGRQFHVGRVGAVATTVNEQHLLCFPPGPFHRT
jgi:hypothetical protein